MGLIREFDYDCSAKSFARETASIGAQSQTEENESDDPSWRVLDNPIYSAAPEMLRTSWGRGELRIRTKNINRSRSEGKRVKPHKAPRGVDGVRCLQRSSSAPSRRDANISTRPKRKIPERRYRSRLKESEAFRNSFEPLWALFISTLMAFGRSLFPSTPNPGDATYKL